MPNTNDTDPEAPQKPRIAPKAKLAPSPAPLGKKTTMSAADLLCPACAQLNDRRAANGSIRIGVDTVLTCKQGHHWSPLGGDAALKALADSKNRMRVARLKG